MRHRRKSPRSTVRWADPDRYYDPAKWVSLPNNREAMRKAERKAIRRVIVRLFIAILLITLLYYISP